ncbi:MAG: hypothetical protein J5504_11800 [Butyrivibrio sp.]|nr:hypothetical protein [Butyrivibrio sp.]
MKHLSRMITAHNCFCSFLYNLGTLVIMPVLLIPVAVKMMQFDSYIGLVIMMSILTAFTLFLDYSTLNGITSRVFSFGMIKNSPYTESFLKDAIIADQLRRFAQITIPPIISMIISSALLYKDANIQLLIFTLTLIFLNYGSTTGILALIRNVLTNTTYTYVSILFNAVLCAINVAMMFLFVLDSIHIPYMIWLPISFILSIIISILVFRYTADRCVTNLKEK